MTILSFTMICMYVCVNILLYWIHSSDGVLSQCNLDNRYLLKKTYDSPLQSLEVGDPMKCVQECLLRTVCTGITFSKSRCILYRHRTDSAYSQNNGAPTYFIPRALWPKRMASICENHVTEVNQRCLASQDGKPRSIVTGCTDPSVDQGTVHVGRRSPGSLWPLNDIVSFLCNSVRGRHTKRLGMLKCRDDGTWTKAICVRPLPSCKAVKQCNPGYKDGEYFLMVATRIMKIYCHDMDSRTPKMFVSLNEDNYGKMSAPELKRACSAKNPHWGNYPCGTTYWNKIKILQVRKLVSLDRYDNTFYKETCPGGNSPYGSTVDCSAKKGCESEHAGFIRVNTTGTGLKLIRMRRMWGAFGAKMSVNAKISGDSHVANVNCRGESARQCGWCLPFRPSTHISMDIDTSYEPDPDSAVSPKCVGQ